MRAQWRLLLFISLFLWSGASLHGQEALFSGANKSDKTPVEVLADQALEWQKDKKIYIAKGNAHAKRGDLSLIADTLIAHYRDGVNGGTQIWKLEAEGNVRLVTPTQKAYGDKGIYNVDQQMMILTGNNLRLETATDVVTARDSLEYWSQKRQAIARGNAVVSREENRLKADALEAYFENDAQGNLVLSTVEAIADVTIVTPAEVLRGNKGSYNVAQQLAILTGDVRITRGDNQLNGEKAEVNLATGISRMLSTSALNPDKSRGRVRGLFVPNQAPSEKNKNPGASKP